MQQSNEKRSYLRLASTNCSIDVEQSDKQDKIVTKAKGKKRIGPYSFYLKNIIGSGYGGRVYKGIKDNNKNFWYAVKVIKLKGMNTANIYLLNNEVTIMRELEHPNIVKFIDVYYTQNHCYLITEYCQGGNLQKYLKHKENIEWGSIVYQVSQGCQYLVNKNVVHRDLKPANIFMKSGIWKIGDFGFAKKISHSGALIIESMKVGSPLFMPLQTLQRNMYSIKSDSYALGVIIFYLIAKSFPHSGKDIQALMNTLKEKELDFSKVDFLQPDILDIIKGLCRSNFRDRTQISEIDFSPFLTHKSIEEMQVSLLFFKGKTTEQVTLCQFINYLMKNSVQFLEDGHILYSLMSNNLYHLTQVFKWEESKCLNQLKSQYILPCSQIKVTDQLYKSILKALEMTIHTFKQRQEPLYQVATQKLLEYYRLSKCILQANAKNLNVILKNLALHQNFHHLKANKALIHQLLPIINAS